MKLLSLQLRNFRQHADTGPIAFPASGIIGIVGSNESGKSTLLEAVTFALYGSRGIRGTKSGVRWHRAPTRHVAEVTLRFEVGGTTYRVERSETNAKVFQEGLAAPVAEGTSAVDAYLPERIGMTLEEFSATYLCAQKDLARLNAMGPTERQTFIRGVMGIGRIDAALKTVRERRNELSHERDGLAAGLGEREPLEAAVTAAAERVESLEGQLEALEAVATEREAQAKAASGILEEQDEKKARHDELVRRRETIEQAVATLKRDEEKATGAVARAEKAAATLAEHAGAADRLPALRAERDELLTAKAAAEEIEQLRETIGRLKAEISTLRSEQATLDETIAAHDQEALDAAAARYRVLEERLARHRDERIAERSEAKTLADAAGAERESIRAQIAALSEAGPEGECPTCTQPLAGHLDAVLATLRTAMADQAERAQGAAARMDTLATEGEEEARLRQELQEVRGKGEELKELRTKAEAARKRLGPVRNKAQETAEELARQTARAKQLMTIEFDPARLREVESEIERIEVLERDTLAPARADAGRLEEYRSELEDGRARLEAEYGRHKKTNVEISDLGYEADLHEAARSAASATRSRVEQSRQDLAAANARFEEAKTQEARAGEDLRRYDARAHQLEDLTEQLRIHSAAADRLNQFRIEQASLIRPELEELTTGFVSILTDGRHDTVSVTEDFDVVLQEAGVDAEVVSGGTEDLAAIALRLAISQMIAERAGHPLSLLVLDEPFGSLDEVRRGNVLNLIRRLSGTFEQVLVISHVAETRDAVDHVIELDYDDAAGASRVVSAPEPEAEAVTPPTGPVEAMAAEAKRFARAEAAAR